MIYTSRLEGSFLDLPLNPPSQVRDYANKKKSAGGKLVDATAETDAEMKREMDKIAKQFGGDAGTDMTKFPDIKFVDPAIEVPDLK